MDPNTNQVPPTGPTPAPMPGPGMPPAPTVPPSSPPVEPGRAPTSDSGPEGADNTPDASSVGSASMGGGGPAASAPTPAWQASDTGMPAPDGGPTLSANSTPPAKNSLPMWLMVTIVGVVIVAALAAGYFLFMKKDTRGATNKAAKNSTNAAKNAVDMATLNMVTLNAPANLAATFKANDLGVPTVKDYNYDNGNCDLQFGTLTAAQLPGTDVGDILAKQIKSFRDAGATVDGPHTADALLVKDTMSGATYSMPTLSMTFKKDNRHAISHYSAVVLKGGNRAFVSRSCVNTTGEVNLSTFNAVDTAAKDITLTKQ